jgi:[acyl-carrier-protein] S-malonyltransferase
MGKTAFLFAGQGSQKTGMGKDFYEAFPDFVKEFDSAELDFDLKEACFENPGDILLQTQYTQPALVAFACGVDAILKDKGIVPDFTVGLSLGEYSALHSAGVFDSKTAIETVAFRGKAMAEASKGPDVGMTAILSFPEEEIKKCCEEASALGYVSICNYNCPGQIVIGGEKAAVDKATELAKEGGARRCVPLSVSGPFHTALMKPAGDKLNQYFKNIEFQKPKCTVLSNFLGGPYSDDVSIPELLVEQVQKPIRLDKDIEYLFKSGVTRFIEIGPGKALTGFVNKTAKALQIDKVAYTAVSIDTVEDLEGIV